MGWRLVVKLQWHCPESIWRNWGGAEWNEVQIATAIAVGIEMKSEVQTAVQTELQIEVQTDTDAEVGTEMASTRVEANGMEWN